MKMLDFNAIQQPTWTIKMKDAAQTEVNLTAPTVELVDRLTAMSQDIKEAMATKDGRLIAAIYELMADIFNCNSDGFTFTAEELRDKYKLTLLDLFKFELGYLEFLKEINEAKN